MTLRWLAEATAVQQNDSDRTKHTDNKNKDKKTSK